MVCDGLKILAACCSSSDCHRTMSNVCTGEPKLSKGPAWSEFRWEQDHVSGHFTHFSRSRCQNPPPDIFTPRILSKEQHQLCSAQPPALALSDQAQAPNLCPTQISAPLPELMGIILAAQDYNSPWEKHVGEGETFSWESEFSWCWELSSLWMK